MKLTIVGLGTVGTCVGLAIRAVTGQVRVVGHDPDPERAKRAKTLGAVDQTQWNLIAACEGADLVFLDLPLAEFGKTMGALHQAGVPSGSGDRPALILDNVPVKRPVLEIAESLTWEGAEFVGGHLVSTGLAGDPEPSVHLLQEGVLYLVPSSTCSETGIDTATNFALSIGTEPRYIDAAEHDGIVAPAFQLPFVGALALLNALRLASGAAERSHANSPALAALQGILTDESHAGVDELLTNKDNLLHWIGVCEREMASWRDLMTTGDDSRLVAELPLARQACLAWLGQRDEDNEAEARPVGALGLRSLLLGDMGRPRRGRSSKTRDRSRLR